LVWQRKPVFKQARRLFSLLFATFGHVVMQEKSLVILVFFLIYLPQAGLD
jgi:hypothetical protein